VKKWVFLFFMMANSVFAADLYPFSSSQEQAQFNRLLSQLRCLVCQNETLSASNAKIAMDLKNKIYWMVQHHWSDKRIKAYLVHRYGNFVLLQPPFITETYLLWLLPGIMLLIGAAVIVWFVLAKRKIRKDEL